ncbi:MAG: MerR family transcriptional regulator [Clostridia bacterium]|nr:MerR family transcriptional regulator [Clostridia bacterium]
MKIKEVIEKTGLTDRAIRLYIDEGLVLPNIAESYSGRKSIEFSENDVERLKNVALLRKAGFSIADIKSMVDDNSTAENIVKNFIEQTENNIAHETEIVEKLKEISFDEGVTIETICDSLSAAVEKKEVPKEDVKLTLKEKAFKVITILFSSVLLANAVYYFVLCCLAVFDVRFIKLTDNPGTITGSLFYLGWVVIAILMIAVILKNIGKRFNRKTKGSLAVLILSAAGTVILIPITLFLSFCTITPFYSQTTDPDNYLKFDDSLMSYDEKYDALDHIYKVFPRKIPGSAKEKHPESIKYFYEYTPCWDGYYGTYDICAEWVLSDADYEKFKENLQGDFILEEYLIELKYMDEKYKFAIESAIENSGYNIVEKGDWTMVYYVNEVGFMNSEGVSEKSKAEQHYLETGNEFEIKKWDTEEYRTSYHFLICAYNDKLQKFRYIASECCYHCTPADGPYYLSLDW